MDMWKILGIEPTTDKRAIKRAYAAKTKETHPEEKPEEFKRLYEAYQTALGYADYVKQISRSGGSVTSLYRTDWDVPEDEPQEAAETTDEEEAPDENPEWEELRTYFEENREKQDQCVDAFLKYWRAAHPGCDRGTQRHRHRDAASLPLSHRHPAASRFSPAPAGYAPGPSGLRVPPLAGQLRQGEPCQGTGGRLLPGGCGPGRPRPHGRAVPPDRKSVV